MAAGKSESTNSQSGVTSTSRSLLVRLNEQDESAWDRLVELYTPLVCHWCRGQRLPEQDLPDVIQEVFKAASLNIDRFRHDRPGDTFRGWLRTISRSKVNDCFRKKGKEATAAGGTEAHATFQQLADGSLESDSGEESSQGCPEATEKQLLFRRALELVQRDFEERTWQAFWKVVVDGMTPKDAGGELDMKPGTVRVAKSRVLARLRQEFGDLM
ncbi:MAG: sigma-70 family RNA polymerase sigma factor [Planctomycetes bacterium]|nr:sigma-70 family RNA polymerase sigma factor [Planctomycetota bacterium]